MSYRVKDQLDFFLDFENKNSLFEIKSEYGYSLWEVLRFDIWMKISRTNSIEKTSEKTKSINILNIFLSIKNIFFNKPEYFFLSFSRSLNESKEFYDPFYKLISSFTKKDILVYEKMINKEIFNKKNNVLDFIYYLNKILCKIPYFNRLYVSHKKVEKIVFILNSSYSSMSFSKNELMQLVMLFHLEKVIFKWILKYKKIKKIFFHGYSKSLLLAGKELGIISYEFQHGDISETTFLYKCNKEILSKNIKSLIIPDNILLYSNVWMSEIDLPSKLIEIGSVFYNSKSSDFLIKDNCIAIISSPLENILLQKLAKNLASLDTTLKIYYKLHPSQFHLFDYHINFFKNYKNIVVVPIKESINDLSVYTDYFIVYYSTVVYELLQLKKIIFLLKGKYHMTLKNYFYLSNLFLIDKPNEIIEIKNTASKKIIRNNISFFKPLNKEALFEILN